MIELYDILSIFVTGGLFLALGIVLLFANMPYTSVLSIYRKTRYVMAGAYLFFVVTCVIEYFFYYKTEDSGKALTEAITLIISGLQAFLFTYALLALLRVEFRGWRDIFRKALPAIIFVVIVFTVYAFCSEACSHVAFYGFAGIYAVLLVSYTHLFISSYRLFHKKMDNYFSDREEKRLQWVIHSFFSALFVGIMALLSVIFSSVLFDIFFTVVFNVFYIYFAIRLVNYPQQFQFIEPAMSGEKPEEESVLAQNEEMEEDNDVAAILDPDVIAVLEGNIEQWIAAKGFTQRGITITVLAKQLFTNKSYFSAYINSYKKQTFREWVNCLRIEEAKTLLLQNPEMNIGDISNILGFSDDSNFRRHFYSHTNLNPYAWRAKYSEV